MKKPIIAMSLSGVLIDNTPWKESHKKGMKELAEKSGMKEILDRINSPDYFTYVEEAIKKIYPNISLEERITKRRKIYFERVEKQIAENPEYENIEMMKILKILKKDYRLVLITTTPLETVLRILGKIDMKGVFDFLGTSKFSDKDDKEKIFKKTIVEYYKPQKFIGSRKSEKICKNLGIGFIEFDKTKNPKEIIEKLDKEIITLEKVFEIIKENCELTLDEIYLKLELNPVDLPFLEKYLEELINEERIKKGLIGEGIYEYADYEKI